MYLILDRKENAPNESVRKEKTGSVEGLRREERPQPDLNRCIQNENLTS